MFKKGKKKQTKESEVALNKETETIEAKEVREEEEIEETTTREKMTNNYNTYCGLFEADNISSLDLLILETKNTNSILNEQNQKLNKLIELMDLALQE